MELEHYCELLGFYLPLAMAVGGLIGLVGFVVDNYIHRH